MPAYNKFQVFVENLAEGIHDLDTHVLKVMLVNAPAPVATNSVKGDLTEIGVGNGYVAGGNTATLVSSSHAAGTYKLVLDDVTFTASGGTIGPFRYAVLYNDTAAGDPLIAWWDYGSNLTLNDTEQFVWDVSAASGVFTIT